MSTSTVHSARKLLDRRSELTSELEKVYTELHAHPELSMRETRTSAEVARWLTNFGYEVTTGIGKTGVVGLLRNGEGPTVMLRADMDALPVKEETGLPYASTATATDAEGRQVSLMHACGHDMHMTCLLGVAALFAATRTGWRGTLMTVFQPAEEISTGAQAMIDDGMLTRFPKPSVVLGQHVFPAPAGQVFYRPGSMMSAADSLQIRLFGRGAHGSQPQASVDPVVMAAATVLRLQTIVSREVDPADRVVVTVGTLQAGTKENIIPSEAILKVNVRTFSEQVRSRVLEAIKRISRAEAAASGAPKEPEFTPIAAAPLLWNDPDATARVVAAFSDFFGHDRVKEAEPWNASEDFGLFGTAAGVPSVFWFLGGWDPKAYADAEATGRLADIPTNHSPHFAPVIQPTLTTGVEAFTVAALAWLAESS